MKNLYRTAAQILRAHGYAPAPIPEGAALPPGPWGLGAMDYSEHERPGCTASAAVFTTLHLRPGVFAGAIADPASTWLATLSMKPNPHATDIERIIARHIGKRPARVDESGSIAWPLKTTGRNFNPFELVSRDSAVRLEAGAPTFFPMAGDWRDGDPLTVPRSALPEIDRKRAEALMSEIDTLLIARTPVPSFEFAAPKPAPAVVSFPRDGELRYGEHVLDTLRARGYEACAVPWGEQLPATDDWKRGMHDLIPNKSPRAGVGIVTAAPATAWNRNRSDSWIATLTLRTAVRELSQFVAAQLGKCPVRESSDGTLVFMLRQDGRNTWPPVEFSGSLKDGCIDVTGTRSAIRIESRNNVLVVSGLDAAKKPYRWRNGDPLSVPRAELPMMNDSHARNLVTGVQRLIERLSLERAS